MAVQFGANINEVNINLQGAKEFSNKSKNTTIGDFVDWGKVVKEAAGLAVQVNETQKKLDNNARVVEANKADRFKKDSLDTPEFKNLSPTLRAEKFEALYKQNLNESETYQNTFRDLTAAEYYKAFQGRQQETDMSYLNSIPAAYVAYGSESSNIPKEGGEGKVTDFLTNDEAGNSLLEFNRDYAKQFNLPITHVRNATMGGIFSNIQSLYLKVETAEDLIEADELATEMRAPLQNVQNLYSTEKVVSAYVKRLQTGVSNTRKGVATKLASQAKTNISLAEGRGFESGNIYNKFTLPASDVDFKTAYGDKWEQKKAEYDAKYDTYENARVTVNNPVSMEDTTYWDNQDTLVKEGFQKRLNNELIGALQDGDLLSKSDTIYNQGQVDTKRLKGTKEYITSTITSGSEVEAEEIIGQLNGLRLEDRHAFNSLYPDREEKMKLIALDSIGTITGVTGVQENYKYLSGVPTTALPVLTRTEQSEKGKVLNDTKIPTPLREDSNSLYSILTAYGMPHTSAIKEVKNYIDSEPYKVAPVSAMPKVQNVFDEELDKLLPEGPSNVYEKDNVIYMETAAGVTTVINKGKLKEKAGKLEVIQEYNKNHWISEGTKKLIGATADNFGRYTESVSNYVNFYTGSILTEDKGLGKMVTESRDNTVTTLNPSATKVPEDESIIERLLTGKISYRPGKGWVTYNKEKK